MADQRDREGSSPRFRAFGCAWALASLVLPAGAFAQAGAPAKKEPAARPAAGAAVIQYEESPGSAILYIEEAGGLVASVAPAIAPRREAAAAPAKTATSTAAAPAPAPAAGARAPRLVTRQVADAEGVAGKR